MSRRSVITAAALGLSAIAGTTVLDSPLEWVWNATGSAPVGLWRREGAAGIGLGDWALVEPSRDQRVWLVRRGYLPRGAPLIKTVSAMPGQVVCRRGDQIHIDGRPVARALPRDSHGRELPRWGGCHHLRPGELFLLSAHPASLDGRYFGATSTTNVLGRATLVWRRDTR